MTARLCAITAKMRRSSRALARSSFALVLGLGAASFLMGACGDDDPIAEAPGAPDAQPDNSARLPPSSNRDSGLPVPGPTDAGRRDADAAPGDASPSDASADAEIDASADSEAGAPPADAGSDASAPDAATPPIDSGVTANTPLGTGPLSIVYAGSNVGSGSRSLATSTFTGIELNAWTATTPATTFSKGTTSVVDEGSVDAIAAWGRWSNGTATLDGQSLPWAANGGVVYAVGRRVGTPPNSGTVALTTAGAVDGIVSDGSSTPGSFTGSAVILYQGGGAMKVGLSLQIQAGPQTFTVTSGGGIGNPSISELVPDANGFFARTNTFSANTPLCGNPGGSCTSQITGFVAGPNANYVGVVLHVYKNPPGDPKTISGAIVFK